jgi:hypothetical protein
MNILFYSAPHILFCSLQTFKKKIITVLAFPSLAYLIPNQPLYSLWAFLNIFALLPFFINVQPIGIKKFHPKEVA